MYMLCWEIYISKVMCTLYIFQRALHSASSHGSVATDVSVTVASNILVIMELKK